MSASKPSEHTAPLIRALKEVLGTRDGDGESDQSKARARAEELIAELETCLGAVDPGTARPQVVRIQDISTVLPGESPPKNADADPRAASPVAPQPNPPIGEMRTFIPVERDGAIGRQAEGDDSGRRHGDLADSDSTVFGPYELIEKVGRGGMGVVYKARQRTLNRIVALKRVRFLDSISPQELKRFQLEAEAAGKLNHPHIVQVYEFGEHAGEQFFTMAYIDGQSLAAKTAQGPMPPREAAELMKAVAGAVAFAHENGVIHRDLKPANILLDANGEPHITDFGLAKKIDEDSSLTATGQVMGTPSYMAPEQAEGKTQDVGPLSDVYSLGAVLYCTLVGRPPFQAANVVETLKQAVDQEPVPPSHLNRSIDRDLETICLKCLSKEPHRRYLSARALADDLGRFLTGDPVYARPVGRLARLWRWSRRNPSLASASAVAAVFLLVGSVVSTHYAIAESRRAKEARANAAEATDNFEMAREAVDNLYTRVSEDILLHRPGLQRVRHELLGEALRYYQRFLAQRRDDTTLRDDLALAHFRVGLITEEIESPAAALPAFQRAIELQRALLGQSPGDIRRTQALADTINAIGRVQHRLKRPDEAYAAFEEAVALRQRLVKAAPEDREFARMLANSLMNLGLVEQRQGRLQEARDWFEKAQTIRRDVARGGEPPPKLQRDLGSGSYNLGTLLLALADQNGDRHHYETARQYFSDAVACFEDLRRVSSDDLDTERRLGNCYRLLGDTEKILERWQDAIDSYQRASVVLDTLVQENPAIPSYRADRAGILISMGELFDARTDSVSALDSFRQAAAILSPLVEQYGDTARYRLDYAIVLRAIAVLQRANGDEQASAGNLRLSAQHLKTLADRFPNEPRYTTELQITEQVVQAGNSGSDRRP